MKYGCYLVFSSFVLLTVSSCHSSDVSSRLNEAEAIIRSNPDSALYLINQIDTMEIRTYRERARYALLNTMAIDRCGTDSSDYSLIVPADIYYSSRGSIDDQTKMHFYKGRLLYNRGDYDSAMKEFMVSISHFDRIGDNWLKGMICSWIAAVYNISNNASEELHYHLKAYNYFIANGDSKYIDNARYLLACSYHSNNSLSISDSLFSLIGKDSRYYPPALLGLAGNEMFKQDCDASRAVELFQKAQDYGASFSIDQYYQYAYALLKNGQKTQGETLLTKLQSFPDDVRSIWWKYHIAKSLGDTEQALSLLERYREKSGEYVRLKQSQSAFKSVSDYYSDVSLQTKETATRIKLLFIIVVLALASIALVIVVFKQRQMLLIKEERDEFAKSNYELSHTLEKLKASETVDILNKAQAKQLWESYIMMYRRQNASLGLLYGKDVSKSALPQHLERMAEEILDEISGSGVNAGAFEQRLNKDIDNVLMKYRQDFPQQTSTQYRFVSLVFAGFKDPTIAAILGVKTSAISTRKNRLKKQVLESGSPNRELYAVFFKNS